MPAPFFLDGPGKAEIDEAIALARAWAILMGDPPVLVASDDYSSKQWATWSQQYAAEAQAAAAIRAKVPYTIALSGASVETTDVIGAYELVFVLVDSQINLLHVGLNSAQSGGNPCTVKFSIADVDDSNLLELGTVVVPNGAYVAELVVDVAAVKNQRIYVELMDGADSFGVRAGIVTTV